jgi:hypothetical protein
MRDIINYLTVPKIKIFLSSCPCHIKFSPIISVLKISGMMQADVQLGNSGYKELRILYSVVCILLSNGMCDIPSSTVIIFPISSLYIVDINPFSCFVCDLIVIIVYKMCSWPSRGYANVRLKSS